MDNRNDHLPMKKISDEQKDELTKLYHRAAAEEIISGHIRENSEEPGTMLLIDVDDFSRVKEQYGQTYADSVLKQIASLIHTNFMTKDIVARIAFDIFLVYCKEVSDRETIEKLVRRLKKRLAEYVQLRDESEIHVSVGAVFFPENGSDYRTLYAHADAALWYAKGQGKNRCCFYNRESDYQSYSGRTYQKVTQQDELSKNRQSTVGHVNRELFDFCFDILSREKDFKRAVYLIFDEVCRYFNFDRSTLEEYDVLTDYIRITNKWVRENDGNDNELIEEFLIDSWKELHKGSETSEYYAIYNSQSEYKDFTEEFGRLNKVPKACIVFPKWEKDALKFAITYETWTERIFTEEEIATLRSITKMLSSFILRFQSKAELEIEYMVGKTAMDSQKLNYFVSSPESYEMFYLSSGMNEQFKNIKRRQKCYEVMYHRDTPCENCPMKNCREDQEERIMEYYDGDEDKWYTVTATRMHNTGFPNDFLICKSDVSTFLQKVKGTDHLTDIMSYEKFRMEALKILKREKQEYALVFLGIQDFARINDEFGYVTGDEVLKAIARIMEADLSEGELLCRVKGDDFIFMVRQRSLDMIKERVRYYTDTLTAQFREKFPGIAINCFGGIYEIPSTEQDVNRSIDKAMKARGVAQKNFYETGGIYVYSKEFELQETEKELMNRIMKDSLKKGGFCVYFQPKVDITTGKISGTEALVRLKDQEGKLISPGRFIPLAEETGLIVEIDHYVYEETFRLMRRWLDEGRNVPLISVNLSRLHLLDDHLPEYMTGLSSKYGLRPEQIELEITESVFFEDADRLIDMIKRLKAVGFVISMDDFGAGYSTLNFMKSLPVDIIKINGGFFMKNKMDEKSRAVISAIMQLSNNLNFKTVSEGVETDEQVEFIKDQGGKYVQGYYFYKPMPPEEYEVLLEPGA